MGVRAPKVSGLTGPAKAFYAAAAASRDRVLVVVPTDAEIERMTADVRFFLTALEGLSDADVARVVLPFPSHEIDPYRGLAPHMDIASARARALHALNAGTARIVVASAAGLLPRVSAPQRVQSTSLTLLPGQEISPIDLGDLLASAGYTREDPVDQSGEFCVRGCVVDFYPAGAQAPVRLEFIGDTIESIRSYDPASQRSIETLDQASIVPLQDLLDEGEGTDRSATVFDYLWSQGKPHVLMSEPEEISAQGEKLTTQIEASYEDALAKGDKVPAPSALVLSWTEIVPCLEGSTALETLSIDDESGVTHIATQPAQEFSGRIQDWVADIRRARERGDMVLFVANSHGRAERTVELLADYDIFAVPVDRAEDSRTASVLVAQGHLTRGFRLPEANVQIWSETDVFEEERKAHEQRRRSAARTFLSDFRDLKVGDLVVHVDNGIGMFVGLKR
ncbi:MAG TPA: hypothetical protein VGD94_05425, partial [Vicinamibacterales bacterium]